jgi:hypothetical protein
MRAPEARVRPRRVKTNTRNIWLWTFARFYVRSERKFGPEDHPGWTAACVVAATLFWHILTVATVVAVLFDRIDEMWNWIRGNKIQFVLSVAGLPIVLYWRYVKRGRAMKLVNRYRRQKRSVTRAEEKKMWLFVLGAPVLYAIVVVLLL